MFGNIGYSELFIIATLAILVIGPKELPAFLRVAGRYFGKMKGFADDFRSQIDDVVRDTQVNDIKDNILKEVEGVKEDVKKGLPTEKDIGLDFSELDEKSGKDKAKVEAHIDDEDENLDWDEPDELIETSADGKVTHHSKKTSEPEPDTDEVASSEPVSDSDNKASQTTDAPQTKDDSVKLEAQKSEPQNAKSQTNGAEKKVSAQTPDGSEDYDYDDDDGALLDEEEYTAEGQTSHDVLEEGRKKFQEAVAAEQAEEKQAALLKKQELERAKSLKREAEIAETNSPQN